MPDPSPVARYVSTCLSWLLPRYCLACRASLWVAEHCLCSLCDPHSTSTGEFFRPGDVRGRALWPYAEPYDLVIRSLKYGARSDLVVPLARQLTQSLPPPLSQELNEHQAVLVPVPVHSSRLHERGFNQAALLARALGQELKRPWTPTALRRRSSGPRQAGATKDARRKQVRDAFEASQEMCAQNIVLVDDVVTTGSTLASCKMALEKVGARVMTCLTVCVREL